MKNKTYKNFGDAFLELKECFPSISYGKIARELDITDSYAWNLPNRRRKAPIPRRMLIEIAKIFKVKPEYFYEFRLYELLDFIDENRRFLDHCIRQSRKYKSMLETGKDIIKEGEFKEEFDELKEMKKTEEEDLGEKNTEDEETA